VQASRKRRGRRGPRSAR